MNMGFQLVKKQPKKTLSLGLDGWKEQTQSVFNDVITQTSLEQSSKDLAIKRPMTAPRSVVSHVVKNVHDDFWWSRDLESKLQ